MHNPDRSHWNAIKHWFRYLVGTKDYGILFGPKDTSSVIGYTDSDFDDCVDSGKSTIRYCFKFGSGAISWKLKLRKCIATSMIEAKYVATSDKRKGPYGSVDWLTHFEKSNSTRVSVLGSCQLEQNRFVRQPCINLVGM